jgi:hypothetical protein
MPSVRRPRHRTSSLAASCSSSRSRMRWIFGRDYLGSGGWYVGLSCEYFQNIGVFARRARPYPLNPLRRAASCAPTGQGTDGRKTTEGFVVHDYAIFFGCSSMAACRPSQSFAA